MSLALRNHAVSIAPKSINDLVSKVFLDKSSFVIFAGLPPHSKPEVRMFVGVHSGGLWFWNQQRERTFVPIACQAPSETGLSFDTEGFTIEKFGRQIRFWFLEQGSMDKEVHICSCCHRPLTSRVSFEGDVTGINRCPDHPVAETVALAALIPSRVPSAK